MTELKGGCSCGAVRYTLTTAPMIVHCCHCTDCQRQTGTAFVMNALIETDRIIVEGVTPQPKSVPTDSGRPHDIYHCPECWTSLWSDYGRRPSLRFVRTGTLDRKDVLTPDVHIFVRSKVPWVKLPEGVPAFEIFYQDAKAVWSAESLTRRAAVAKPKV